MTEKETNPQRDERVPAHYANFTQVGYNASEFLLDFGQFYADGDEPQFHTRIVTGPLYAKAFFETLQASLQAYEAAYGSITKGDEPG